jgi:hypothetical protein
MSKLGVLLWRHIFESGDAKRLATQVQDLSDLHIVRDLPYWNDGEQGHLFDIYELPGLPDDAPVLINIHGGGLFASYKEVNVNFNYEWARLGWRVISLSYRRIPETTLWHQIDDVMAALRYLREHAADLRAKQTDTLETAAAELRDNIDRAHEADREEEKKAAKTTEKKAADKTEKTDNFGNAPKADKKESADAEPAVQTVIPDPIRAPKPMDVKA